MSYDNLVAAMAKGAGIAEGDQFQVDEASARENDAKKQYLQRATQILGDTSIGFAMMGVQTAIGEICDSLQQNPNSRVQGLKKPYDNQDHFSWVPDAMGSRSVAAMLSGVDDGTEITGMTAQIFELEREKTARGSLVILVGAYTVGNAHTISAPRAFVRPFLKNRSSDFFLPNKLTEDFGKLATLDVKTSHPIDDKFESQFFISDLKQIQREQENDVYSSRESRGCYSTGPGSGYRHDTDYVYDYKSGTRIAKYSNEHVQMAIRDAYEKGVEAIDDYNDRQEDDTEKLDPVHRIKETLTSPRSVSDKAYEALVKNLPEYLSLIIGSPEDSIDAHDWTRDQIAKIALDPEAHDTIAQSREQQDQRSFFKKALRLK